MTSWLNEQDVENAAIEYFKDIGYDYVHGSEIEPDGKHPERESFAEVLLLGRLEESVERINPSVPHEKIQVPAGCTGESDGDGAPASRQIG